MAQTVAALVGDLARANMLAAMLRRVAPASRKSAVSIDAFAMASSALKFASMASLDASGFRQPDRVAKRS